ncbi:unnamed protein product [Linum trigynum]|uniref:Uncharacterized protein n=1 Tax=Linum trigynum TaxID=586398 RepID=A0AAV2DE43_9ROSI
MSSLLSLLPLSMSGDTKPPEMEVDHSLKPPDGSLVQPAKKSRASTGEGFSSKGRMDVAIVTVTKATEDPDEIASEF